MIPVKLPKEVLALFPMWEHRCPSCNTYVEPSTPFCPNCKAVFNEKRWRVPPRFLKSKEAMSKYAHNVLAPKLTPKLRALLLKYFTTFIDEGFESCSMPPSGWTQSGTGLSCSNEQAKAGSYSMKSVGSTAAYIYKTFTGQQEAYARIYIYIETEATFIRPIQLRGDGNLWMMLNIASNYWSVYYVTDGGGNWGSTHWEDLSLDTWYCFEIAVKRGTASDGWYKCWKDDTPYDNITGQDNDGVATEIDEIRVGRPEVSGSYTHYIDCIVVADTYIGPISEGETYTKTWATDVLFKKLGIPKTFAVDTALQKQDISKTFDVDVAFLKRVSVQRQIDVLFKKLDILETFGVDVDFLKKDVIKGFAVDARFGAVVTHTISRQIDVLFEKLGVTRTFGIDTYFGAAEAVAYTKSFALDVVFAYRVRLPEIWLDEEGRIVLNVSRPYVWVGS